MVMVIYNLSLNSHYKRNHKYSSNIINKLITNTIKYLLWKYIIKYIIKFNKINE